MRLHAARRVRAVLISTVLCLAALATLGFPGCPEGPTGPGDGSSSALTMSNCWPNDDGRFWNYAIVQRFIWPEEELILSPPGQQVPEITTELAKQLLSHPATYFPPNELRFGMQFRGMTTSAWGVEGQNLLRSLANSTFGSPASTTSGFGGTLHERHARARPDLRARLAAAGVAITPPSGSFRPGGNVYPSPFIIPGRVWVKGPSWIGTYDDADTTLAWKFLESDVRPGHKFRHPLGYSPANNVWQLAEVDRKVRVELPGGMTVNNAIEVIYVIDYGVGEATDQMGSPLGSYREITYGRVTYAPGVGPVEVLERHHGFLGKNAILGDEELRLDLLSTGVNPPPAVVAAEKR